MAEATKETRKERKKRQKAYEKQLIAEGKIRRHKSHRVLFLLLGFFLGIIFILGSVAGIIYLAGVKFTLKKVFNLVNVNYSEFITEEAANKTLIDLVADVTKADFSNLNSIADYTPLVKSALESVNSELEEVGISVNIDELMGVNFNELTTYLQDSVLMNIALGGVLKIADDDTADPIMRSLCYRDGVATTVGDLTEHATDILNDIRLGEVLNLSPASDPITLTICYGKKGENYTVKDGKIQPIEAEGSLYPVTVGGLTSHISEIIDGIEIETLLGLGAQSEAALRYLAYGTNDINYKIENDKIVMLEITDKNGIGTGEYYKKKTVGDLTKDDADLVGGAQIKDLMNVDANASNILKAIQNWTINDFTNQENINSLKLSDVLEIEGDDGLMGTIKGWTIKELTQQYRIERLKIREVIDIGPNPSLLMSAIADWRISDLTSQSKINSLTLGNVIEITEDSPRILQSVETAPIGALSETIDSLRLSDIIDEEDLEKNKILKNLRFSTLTTLSDDIRLVTVEEVFDEDLYSYLSIAQSGGTFEQLVTDYMNGGKDDRTSSSKIPKAIPAGSNVKTTYSIIGTTQPVEEGYFINENGRYALIEKSDVYSALKVVGDKEVLGYHTYRHTRVLPVYVWRTVDYTHSDLIPLPAGESITETTDGIIYRTAKGTYPVLEDNGGFYTVIDGVRTDFDRAVTGYFMNGRTLPLNASGKVLYNEKAYTVYREKGSGETYIKLDIEVSQNYYIPNGGTTYDAVYTASQVKAEYVATWVDAGGITHENDKLDRYLSGVWYLLFGEAAVENGEVHITDHTDMPVLEISSLVSTAAEKINNMPLWELYLHGFITENPFQEISYGSFRNLNELTIANAIVFIRETLNAIGSLPFFP